MSDDDHVDDPETFAQLQAWFGGPFGDKAVAEAAEDLVDIDPELIGTSREPGIPDFLREARQRREATLEAIDMSFVSALETQGDVWGSCVSPPSPPDPILDVSIATFDPARLELAHHGVGKRATSDEITEAMTHCTPQALLRDLHRIVEDAPEMYMDQLPLGVPKMAEPSTHVTKAMGTCHTVFIDQEPQPRRFMAEDMSGLHASLRVDDWELPVLTGPSHEWHEHPSGDEMMWFAGIDPDELRKKMK